MRKQPHIYLYVLALGLFIASCSSHKKVVVTKNTETNTSQAEGKKTDKTEAILQKYAAILSVDEKQLKNTALYIFINDWYGVPYKYGGKDKQGVDCSGFSMTLYNTVYHKQISPSAKTQAEESKKIDASDLKEGDLVFFDINSGKISHVGVYLQNNKFIHASTKKGVIINDLNEPYYKKYFVRSGRVK
ncbi:MAG: C40 family peptidase [Bacteroidetes bacterium]|nr:C40 family peptidase [Bacteroidota bacterium]